MRLIALTTLLALVAGACGGGSKPNASQAAAAVPGTANAAAAPATPATEAVVVEVKMTGNGTTKAAFEPAALTIKAGSTVRFINVSGGPHNVALDRKSTRLNSSHTVISYAVFCLKKKKLNNILFNTERNDHAHDGH